MRAVLEIDGRMPDLNDWRDAIQASPHKGNDMCHENANRARKLALQQRLPKFEGPVMITFFWVEPNARRDLDNIGGSARKWIIDGLVKAGVLGNDSQKWVRGIQEFVAHDPLEPRIIVEITDEMDFLKKGL